MINEDVHKKSTMSVRLTIIMMRIIGMCSVASPKEKLLANTVLVVITISIIISVITMSDEIYYARGDLLVLCYYAPCASIVASEFTKLTVYLANRKRIINLNKFVEEQFWNVQYNQQDTEIFNQCDRLCFKIITAYVICLQGVCWHYLLIPFYESIGKNASERVLPFPIYASFPTNETPYYELMYVIQCMGTFSVCTCSTTFATYLFDVNMFTAAQFRILNAHLQLICEKIKIEDNEERIAFHRQVQKNIKECIRKHQMLIKFTGEIENLYSYVMLGQMFGSVTQICFSGFQILLFNTMKTSPLRLVLSLELFLGSILQLYFYCYSSHEIFLESQNVSESIYFSKWSSVTHQDVRKDFALLLQIVMRRATRPCILTVGKFCPLSLDTFASVLRTSLSYFTVLRQTME